MNRKIYAILLVLTFFAATPADARNLFGQLFSNTQLEAKVGFNIGAAAPMGMPATIRKLHTFSPLFNPQIGIDAIKPINDQWGLLLGLHVENKGMHTNVTTKYYHMKIVRAKEELEGVFTGRVTTTAGQLAFTVPLQAVYRINEKWRLRCGPYVSYVLNRNFHGDAYNGYLRVNDPTGAYVSLGEGQDERGSYDFSSDMRRFQMGFDLGADMRINRRLGAYADLAWGVMGIFHSSFNTVEQTLYPVYGTLGITYRISKK